MLKFSANLTFLFTEVDFLQRFEKAAQAGFKAVEYMQAYQYDKEQLGEALDKNRLEQVLFNLPPGDLQAGERGIACLPDRVAEFEESVGKAIDYAKLLKCPRLNCLSGIPAKGSDPVKVRQTLVKNLRFAAEKLQKAGIKLEVEALNSQDVPGFYLLRTKDVLDLYKEVNHPNLWLQYDIYNMQIMEGNLTKTITDNIARIEHMQLGDVPGRHEPGTGEINFDNLFKFIEGAGYKNWIGCEYKPAGKTEDGLGWVKKYLKG